MKQNSSLNKNNFTKQVLLMSIFLISALLIETITFLLLGFQALPQYLLLDVSILLILAGIIFIIPSFKVQQIIFAFIIVVQIVLSYINVTLYHIFGTVLTIDMINLFGEAANAIESSVINRGVLFLFIFLMILYIFGNVVFAKKFNMTILEQTSKKLKIAFFILITFIGSQFIGYYTFQNEIEKLNAASTYQFIGDDGSLYDTLLFEAESLKKFGTFGFYFQDINTTLFNLEKDRDERIESALSYLEEGQIAPIGQYTGVSAGNNLIIIMAESLEWYGISELLTPTLYSIKTQQASMENYYSKSKTNISEAFGFLGSYPLSQSFSSVLPGTAKLTENNFNYSLPNLLKQEGYAGNNYLINHKKSFYKRDMTHYNFGFEEVYDISDFEVQDSTIKRWGDWVLDSEFFKGAIDTIAPMGLTQPFFNWVTTMSMHGPYEGNYRLEKYIEEMETLGWQNPYAGESIEHNYQHYLAAVMDLDRAIEYLFEELEVRNLLDTTTVVIYSDHETYYHDLGITVKGAQKENYQNPEIYRVPFMIYDNNLPTIVNNDFSCPYDIMPTIMDLLGISYNKNMYMGNSVLNEWETTNAFWSLTGGVFNKQLFTTNGLNIVENSQVTELEKEAFLNDVEDIIYKILKFNDLYNYNLLQN